MSHPADKLIVGALYKDRRGGRKAQCEGGFKSDAENARLLGFFDGKTQGDDLEKHGWVGFGMVRTHRSVFERMKEAAKPGGPLEEIAPPKGRETSHTDILIQLGKPEGRMSNSAEGLRKSA